MKKGQSAVEWLMTHAWSIIIVLTVSAVLFYSGVLETTGRPRFEGLAAASLKPMPEQVQLYSDGVLVLAIANTKPYKFTFDWVEVAPIADKDNTIRTTLDAQIPQGDIGIYYVNGTNLLGGISGAAVMMLPDARAGEDSIDFHYRHQESYHAAGTSNTYTTPWAKALQIQKNPQTSTGGGGITTTTEGPSIDCSRHRSCTCDKPQAFDCQVCHEEYWDNYYSCSFPIGNSICWEGGCVWDGSIDCGTTGFCPLTNCQICSGGFCESTCSIGMTCKWTEPSPLGVCD